MNDPSSNQPYNQDEEQLRLLALFHKIIAGIYALFSLCGLPHFVIGIFATNDPAAFASKGQPPDRIFGPMFMIFGGFFILAAWTFGMLNWIASGKIQTRRGLTLVYVVAALNCLWTPIGTALGVFTFIVVTRQSVKPLFRS